MQPPMNATGPDPAGFAPPLLTWFRRHGRHDLPWQRMRTAYRVWISEIMLQQTQVATVIPYYKRFVERFPDVRALADAPLDAVLHAWSGLGYYARARNLHRTAAILRDAHGADFPRDFAAVVALPGIGPSTAGAILALALDERHPILDGNVKRVLARWFGIAGFPGEARVTKLLWSLTDAVTPSAAAADYTQAIMDLGATLCTRTQPACERCPVCAGCVARREGATARLPTPRPRRLRPQRAVFWLVVRRGESVLLEQRPPAGIWGGLWAFPEFATRALAESMLERIHGSTTGSGSLSVGPTINHSFSHFDLAITPLVAELAPRAGSVMEGPAQTWYNSREPARVGLAAPVARLLHGDAAPLHHSST
jgi:A/G-specific adenine glycosylase